MLLLFPLRWLFVSTCENCIEKLFRNVNLMVSNIQQVNRFKIHIELSMTIIIQARSSGFVELMCVCVSVSGIQKILIPDSWQLKAILKRGLLFLFIRVFFVHMFISFNCIRHNYIDQLLPRKMVFQFSLSLTLSFNCRFT